MFDLLPIQHRVLIVGGGERAPAIANVVGKHRVNYRVVGYVDDDLAGASPDGR